MECLNNFPDRNFLFTGLPQNSHNTASKRFLNQESPNSIFEGVSAKRVYYYFFLIRLILKLLILSIINYYYYSFFSFLFFFLERDRVERAWRESMGREKYENKTYS